MIVIFISLFIVVMSCNFFTISFQINGINRLVLATPIALFETSVVLFDLSNDESPYFDKQILEDNINSYFDFSLPRYSQDYDISVSYYNQEDHSICLSDKPEATEITIQATLDFSFEYQKTMYYEIRSQ